MAIETTTTRTRRALLGAGLGALAATVASAIGRPLAARATDNDIVHVGDFNITGNTQETRIGSSSQIAITGESTNATGWGLFGAGGAGGVVGWGNNNGCGVTGQSQSVLAFLYGPIPKTGVYGVAHQDATSRGVLGRSTAGVGVQGEAVEDVANHPGIWGTGVIGLSGPGTGAVPAKTGVYGYAAQDAAARGVTGKTTAGRGVNGIATSGSGVYGHTDSGFGVEGIAASGYGVSGTSASNFGVFGHSDSSVAVYAEAPAGIALQTVGRVKLATSGIAIIPAGLSSVAVSPPFGVDVSIDSFVLLTPMANLGTRALWFTKNITLDTITIHLSSSRSSATKVSWLLLG
jgi:hypothetical protein